ILWKKKHFKTSNEFVMKSTPLISCLCVTRNRVNLLKRSIDCFLSQSYPNAELIVVSEDDDEPTSRYMKNVPGENIRHIVIGTRPKLPLGALRNFAIEAARGEYFCQWDDDDWYHNDRISTQFHAAVKNFHPGSILTNWLMFDHSARQAYF